LAFSAGLLLAQPASAPPPPDPPAPVPQFLLHTYVGLQVGYIGYPFSSAQVAAGFQAQSVQVPHLAARVFLFGYEFNKYFSAQISDMRPVYWVKYRDVNGDRVDHQVWMNVAGLTGKLRLPLAGPLSAYGEGGLGIVTRKGFAIGPSPVVSDASYSSILFGGGLAYRLAGNWDLLAGVTVAPGRSAVEQPRTSFFSGGFNYTVRRLPAPPAAADSTSTPLWPQRMVQIGYITSALGYGANNFVSKGAVPVFWSGSVEAASGLSADYQCNLFHTRRFFAFDWGAGVSSWKSAKQGQRFYTASLYPVLRFPLVRTNPLEFYLSYSLAGPSFITRTAIDGEQTGRRFTFQDFMAAGIYLGPHRRVAAEVRIAHYSNGNLFPQNPGVTIPLGFYLGSTF
jgi:hypothetical protein